MCKKPLSDRTKSALKDLLLAVVTAIATFIATIFCTSCGVTSARIYSSKDSAVSTITITTNNPTSTTVNTDATGTLDFSKPTSNN